MPQHVKPHSLYLPSPLPLTIQEKPVTALPGTRVLDTSPDPNYVGSSREVPTGVRFRMPEMSHFAEDTEWICL